jgi:sugar phosphate isomerase/epimerase
MQKQFADSYRSHSCRATNLQKEGITMLAVSPTSRRAFLKTASASIACASLCSGAPWLMASALGLPLGLQLFSVRELLPKDYEGTLKQLGSLGYQEVEAAGFFNRTTIEVKKAINAAKLRCVSAHYSLKDLLAQPDATIHFCKSIGLQYVVCSSPYFKDPSRVKDPGSRTARESMTLDDWKWNADQFNHIGEQVNIAGMNFAYHNHTPEFRSENGVMFYDELLRLTDPAKVSMELDCGWAAVAGQKPAELLTRYRDRIKMLHVKDFKLTPATTPANAPPSTELGHGTIDYRPIFAAARNGEVKHIFVEQEEFDMPPMDALKIDADYIRSMI